MKKTKQIVDSLKNTYGKGNSKKGVTVHQTGNTSRGADAKAHANIQSNGNPRQASWHYSVDDSEAIQSYPHTIMCWHAGDGRGFGNTQTISVEICINSDGDYKKSVSNGAKLVKSILDEEGLTINDVYQHADHANKNCPAQIRSSKEGIGWEDFLEMVEGVQEEDESQETNSEVKPPKSTGYASMKQSDKNKEIKKALSDQGVTVAQAQRMLQACGIPLPKFGADGIPGGETSSAFEVFQKKQGISTGQGRHFGRPGPQTVRTLKQEVRYRRLLTHNVRPLLRGEDVRQVQRVVGTNVDGIYGPATSREVRNLQRKLGVSVDGLFGRNTFRACFY